METGSDAKCIGYIGLLTSTIFLACYSLVANKTDHCIENELQITVYKHALYYITIYSFPWIIYSSVGVVIYRLI